MHLLKNLRCIHNHNSLCLQACSVLVWGKPLQNAFSLKTNFSIMLTNTSYFNWGVKPHQESTFDQALWSTAEYLRGIK